MTDAQIMVKISDEVLAFELDQPRHATSLQISCFLQINTGYSKVGSRLYQFDPSERPCSSPGGGCIFTFATWYVFSTLRIICASIFFCPLFFQKFEKAKNYSDLITPTSQLFFFSYYDTCIVCTIQTAHHSRRRKFIYMPVRMKGEKFTRCIKIYIRVSSWGHSTNEKSPDQFSNFPSTTTFPSIPTTK